MSSLPRVRVALPWVQSALAEAVANEAVPQLDALNWLGGHGRLESRPQSQPWREWLLESVAGAPSLDAVPAGPVVAARYFQRENQGLGEHSDPAVDGASAWCLAQPVHLAAGLDHLRLAPLRAAAPTAAEAGALAATIDDHFADGDFAVAGFETGAWLLRFNAEVECVTQPPDHVVGQNVRDFMPAGRDGARVRSLMNEIQMLLHEHPVNLQRERTGQLAINSWWLWGFGTGNLTRASYLDTWALHTDDTWLSALWRSQANKPEQIAAQNPALGEVPFAGLTLEGDTLIALMHPPAQDSAGSLAAIDGGLLAWLVAQVRAGKVEQLELVLGDVMVSLDRWARFRFWRRPLDTARWLR